MSSLHCLRKLLCPPRRQKDLLTEKQPGQSQPHYAQQQGARCSHVLPRALRGSLHQHQEAAPLARQSSHSASSVPVPDPARSRLSHSCHLAWSHCSTPGLGHGFFPQTRPDCHTQNCAHPEGSCRLCTRSRWDQDCGPGAFSLLCLISTDLAPLSSHEPPPHCGHCSGKENLHGTYKAAAVQGLRCAAEKLPRLNLQLWSSEKSRNVAVHSTIVTFLMRLSSNIEWVARMVIFQHRTPASSEGCSYIMQYKS